MSATRKLRKLLTLSVPPVADKLGWGQKRLRSEGKSSRHQQDLPDTTLFCRCVSLDRFTEWQFPANRDY
jgi:hypothetical protein